MFHGLAFFTVASILAASAMSQTPMSGSGMSKPLFNMGSGTYSLSQTCPSACTAGCTLSKTFCIKIPGLSTCDKSRCTSTCNALCGCISNCANQCAATYACKDPSKRIGNAVSCNFRRLFCINACQAACPATVGVQGLTMKLPQLVAAGKQTLGLATQPPQ